MKKSRKFTFLATACAVLGAFTFFSSVRPVSGYLAKADDGGVPTVQSLFTATEGATLTTNVDTPSYVAEKRNGVHVRSEAGATVTYNRLIDVTELTKANTLFEVQITPDAVGVSEFNQLLVRVEDSENPKSFFEVSLMRYYYGDSGADRIAHVSVKPDSIESYTGRYYTNKYTTTEIKEEILDGEGNPVLDADGNPTYNVRKEYKDNPSWYMREGVRQATMVFGPFAGSKGGASNSLKVYYNDDEKMVYTDNASLWSPNMNSGILTEYGIADENGIVPVIDMDNPSDMGILKTSLWSGFPSGKVRISFTTNELFGDVANYMILTIDDQKFDGELLNDVTAPKLAVDLAGYDGSALPEAKVGQKYPFFSATAVDKMYGDLAVKAHVYKDSKELYTTGDGFVPETAGDYVIEYMAYDGNRNTTTERFTVTATETIEPISGELNVANGALDFSDDSLKNANGNFPVKLYYPVLLPTVKAEGGSGKTTVNVQVLFNGKQQSLQANGTFVPQASGVYTVRYFLSDHIGNTQIYEYNLEAVYEEAPRLIIPSLPDYFSVGKSVKLPALQSELYTVWKQKIKTYDEINIYKADGTTKLASFTGDVPAIYTPSASDGESVVVEYYTAKDGASIPVTYRKTVKLLVANKLSDRFATEEGITLNEKSLSLNYDFSAEAAGKAVKFVNPLSIFDGVRIVFNVPKEKNNYTEAQFKIIDASDPNVYIVVSFHKNPEQDAPTSFISVNGGAMASFPASFYGNVIDDFIFTVYADGSVYNYNEDVVAQAIGFAGFTGDYVYVECSLYGISGEAEISLLQIKNQVLGDVEEDFINPILTVYEEPVGLAELGDKIEISGAVANDVYDIKTSLSVAITFDGKEIYTYSDPFGLFDGTSFIATDYGIYKITYTATDETGNKVIRNYSVEIRDVTAPTLKLAGDMPTTWTKGTTFSFPTVTAADNVDATLTVYTIVINPMNVYTVMEPQDTYTPTMSGRYIIRFYCQDSRYNTTYSVDYVIQVK